MAKKSSSGLTPLEERACHELLKDDDQAAAYKRAGSKAKPDSLKSGASRCFAKPEAQALVAKLRAERNEKVSMDATKLLDRLVDEYNADIAEIYKADGSLKPIQEWPMVFRTGLVTGIEVEETKVKGKVVAKVGKVKLESRHKKAEAIGKHVNVQAFTQRHEVTGKDGGPIEVETKSPREVIEKRLAEMAGKLSKGSD